MGGLITKLTGELSLPSEHPITNVLIPIREKYISFNTKNQTINIMKNSLKALVVVAILAVAGLANAQNSASATATANATVVCPISIHNNTNLEFGTITNSASGGTVVVGNGDAVSYSGVANFTGTPAGATPHEADFTVGGEGGFSYSVTPTIATNFGGSGATLSALTWEVPANTTGNNVFPCENDADNDPYEGVNTPGYDEGTCGCVTDDLKVGGTLTLTSAASGAYSATINVAVAYN
jgi:hypothetical protein